MVGLNGEVEAVQVGLAEASLFDLQQLHFFKLLEVGADAALRGSHVLGEGELAGKARVVGPGVFEQHRVSEFGADGNLLVGENKIRHLREAVARGEVGADDLDVAVFENVADGPRLPDTPSMGHYTLRANRSRLLIPYLQRSGLCARDRIDFVKMSRLVAAGRDRGRLRRRLRIGRNPQGTW